MKYYHIKNNLPKYMLIFAAAISAGSCTDDFLEPDPLSIYEPTKTFTTREALESALAICATIGRIIVHKTCRFPSVRNICFPTSP